ALGRGHRVIGGGCLLDRADEQAGAVGQPLRGIGVVLDLDALGPLPALQEFGPGLSLKPISRAARKTAEVV
ncbi:MAG: hypothetical protein ACK55I_06355, partial [bacterium]